MSNLTGLVVVIAVAEAALVAGVYLALRVFHQRKYRATKARLAGTRQAFAEEKTIRRLKLLAVLDTMLARCDRLIVSLSSPAPRPARPALAGGKHRNRKRR